LVAYNFKQRFIAPIRRGLGDGHKVPPSTRPKLQTIRAPRNRHAMPGEQVQLYYGMRTKECFLIGKAICTAVPKISMSFVSGAGLDEHVIVEDVGHLSSASHLDQFSRLDGFEDWVEMKQFWAQEHPGSYVFDGVLVRWKPFIVVASIYPDPPA